MSLRFRLNLIITLVMTLFALAIGAVVIEDTRRAIREEMEAGSKVTLTWLTNILKLSPFMDAKTLNGKAEFLDFLNHLGRVRATDIHLLSATGELLYQSPPSLYKPGRQAPRWFSILVAPELAPVSLKAGQNTVVLTQDASRAVLDAWDDLKLLLLVMLGFLVLLNTAVFWLVSHSLRPVGSVLRGLSAMEQGHLNTRLPDFSLPEFSAISHTFNRMAQAVEEGHAEHARLGLIVKQSSDAIMITDARGEITFWNPAAEAMFGYGAEEIVGLSARLITPAGKAQELSEQHRIVFARKTIENQETERCTKNGRLVQVALSAAPLTDPETDAVVGEICSMRDITEHKRAQQAESELKSNRELTHMIQASLEEERRGIARELHDELGQCVTAIRTIGAVIASKTKDSAPEVHSSAQTIVDVATHIYDVVHGIIRKLRPSALDHLGIEEALRDMVETWRARNPHTVCELRMSGRLDRLGETLNITLYRIVQECLTNIVKHAHARHVTIDVTRTRDEHMGEVVEVSVQDDGQGLNAGSDRDSRFGILGMRERVQALQGEFAVRSEPGKGVRVNARVPIQPPANAPAEAAA